MPAHLSTRPPRLRTVARARRRRSVTRSLYLVASLCLALAAATGYGQEGASPFDLTPRLEGAAVAKTPPAAPPPPPAAAPLVATAAPAPPVSPFDILRGRAATVATADSAAPGAPSVAPLREGAAAPSPSGRARFDSLLAFGLLTLLTASFVAQGGSLRRMWSALFNDNLLGRLQRDQHGGGYLWWATLGAALVGVFAFVALRQLQPAALPYSWSTLGLFALGGVGVMSVRMLALTLLAVTFPLGKPIEGYRTATLVWAAAAGVLAFPLLVVIAFGESDLAGPLAYAGAGLLALAYVVYVLRATAAAASYVLDYPLHFLLYLCALEIGPLAIGYRSLVG